ncbi:MAG: heme lyase CcmF/NrfE family subunit [Proteobacteria bacterium]|nr:heme lyase CcmF/NrfE family subunit [Pseudomonadota bacterium]
MIAEIGLYALVLALVVSLVQATLPLIGAARRIPEWVALAAWTAPAQLVFIAVAFGALTYAYVVSDFSLLNVAANSHSAKPMIYKVSGVWGNHEGSLVLWVLILALFGAAVAGFGSNLPVAFRARVLAVQAWIAVGFLAFILFTSNPFLRLDPPPADGRGLNPLLQDIGLALHPPFLYLGYVGFSITFSFAIAALIEGKVDAAWARWVRPWTLAAWSFLTLGIALGSWWAYYELGWGGWWYWDPVENSSFMPWLVGTALLHSAVVVEKRDALKTWTVLLAIITFAFSLLGTFLVRSGVLTSVHAFATDPARGIFILGLIVVYVGGALFLYAARAQALAGGGLFAPISREGALVLNNLLLTTAAATVLLGTLYPLFVDLFELGKISVGPPYFNATFVPLMIPMLVALGIGPMLAWKRGDLGGALARLTAAFAAAAAVALATLALAWGTGAVLAALAMALAAWLVVGALSELAERTRLFRAGAGESWRRLKGLPRSALGMTLAHLGVGILVAGMTGSLAWTAEDIRVMRPGERVAVADYDLELLGVREGVMGPNYRATRAGFAVSRAGAPVAVLEPEKRFYLVEERPTTEAAILTTWRGDLYAVIGDPDGKGGWVVRLYYKPMILWIWAGAALMALAGALSLSDRRLRVGAPTRARRRRGAEAPARA